MTTYQRHLYSNRLRRCPRRVGQLTHEILVIQKRAAESSRDLLGWERDNIGLMESQKNCLMDRARELELTVRDL